MALVAIGPVSRQRYWVYILTNRRNGRLYVGVTNSLQRRVGQHQAGEHDSFTRRYAIHRLVWFEEFFHVRHAIAREKQIKGGSRAAKVELIEAMNPTWKDLGAELFAERDRDGT